MTENGPEQKQFPAGNIEFVAQNLAQGITPMLLLAQGMNEEAGQLQGAIDEINQDKLMGLVEVRVKDLLKSRIPKKPKVPRARRHWTPRQRYLEEAHPQGYDGMWHIQTSDRKKERSEVFDPERKINQMHYRRLYGSHIIIKDAAHAWRQQLSFWKESTGEKRKRIEEEMKARVKYLIKVGAWQVLEKGFSEVERQLIHAIVSNYQEPL